MDACFHDLGRGQFVLNFYWHKSVISKISSEANFMKFPAHVNSTHVVSSDSRVSFLKVKEDGIKVGVTEESFIDPKLKVSQCGIF